MLKIVNILKQIPNTDANNTNLENKVFWSRAKYGLMTADDVYIHTYIYTYTHIYIIICKHVYEQGCSSSIFCLRHDKIPYNIL